MWPTRQQARVIDTYRSPDHAAFRVKTGDNWVITVWDSSSGRVAESWHGSDWESLAVFRATCATIWANSHAK